MVTIRIFVIFLSLIVAAQANKYYCQYTCNNGKTNLGCDHSQEPDETCVDFKRLRLGAKEQQIILDEHNRLRSLVATGQAKNGKGEKLPPAKNMNHLLWCNEMAYLAYLNVLQCKMRHDECRDTYTQNGQNLYNVMSSTNLTIEHVIGTGIEMWFDEIEDVELSEIESFTGGKGKIIGHFTQLVWAKSTYVGCALATYKRGNLNSYLLACNYVNGNMLFESVYDAGKTCAECSSCTDTGLCKPYSPY
ncbi:venom allergen 5-like [Ctenocephalides felis]|uniref:venom allergen 5-like n=1 Tax=Ctenocephalides felis TaxID=7515 RepID=UPI000E6E32C5|nr:venom allergen 5-like [Ctenocephalides felis]